MLKLCIFPLSPRLSFHLHTLLQLTRHPVYVNFLHQQTLVVSSVTHGLIKHLCRGTYIQDRISTFITTRNDLAKAGLMVPILQLRNSRLRKTKRLAWGKWSLHGRPRAQIPAFGVQMGSPSSRP